MIGCSLVERLLWEYPEDLLTAEQKREISQHLESCPRCIHAYETIRALRASQSSDQKLISAIDTLSFDDAVLRKIKERQKAERVGVDFKGYRVRMAMSIGLAAAIVVFLILSVSDLADRTAKDVLLPKKQAPTEDSFRRIEIELQPPKSEEAPKTHARAIKPPIEKEVDQQFSILPAPVAAPAPESVNIEAVYLTDEAIPKASQTAEAALSEIVVDTGLIQSAERPASQLVRLENMPTPIEIAPPQYPVWAWKRKLSGVVWIKAKIDVKGKVVEAVVASSSLSGAGFEEAALEAARKSIYQPALSGGVPIPVWIIYPVKFIYKG